MQRRLRLCAAPALALLLAAAAAAAEIPACPVRLLDIVPEEPTAEGGADALEGLRLSEEGLEYLAQLEAPLYMVPALGVYRGGKSLLLNRLMGLRAPYLGGFGVGHEQQTFTRGIDVCGQRHEGLGTVVWMDTEGLFSSEDARSAYGPKIFSLALLFSSSVLLNNVKVLNEQFFTFFSEQQQIARVLKQGLTSAGLPADALLPGNLSVFWVLQQPIRFESSGQATRAQLDAFLSLPGDESRARVSRDFEHHVREVPIATHDARQWGQLDRLPDERLLPEYINASDSLQSLILHHLRGARPLQPAGVAAQLRLYVELVQTESFSGTLAKEAFEESEIGTLCDHYGRAASALAGSLPSLSLQSAFDDALRGLETPRAAAVEAFHLSSDWSRRLDRCLRAKQEELRRQNAEEVLAQWKAAAREVAEEGGCFFLGTLTQLLKEYGTTYGQTFSHAVQVQAVDFASALQRTRLVECVRLRDFLLPLAPWLAWPIFGFYLRDSVVSGFLSLALHVVVLAGLYAVMQLLHQLPPYLDVDYPVLRAHPVLLDLAMRAPPMVPWAAMGRVVACVGAVRSLWKLARCLLFISRPAGQGHYVGQMVNMELKLNAVLKRSEAMFKQELIAASLSASDHIEHGDARSAARSLLRLLCLAREVTDDWTLGATFDLHLRKKARILLQHFKLPPPMARGMALSHQCQAHKIEDLVAQGDWDGLLAHAMWLLEQLNAESRRAARPGVAGGHAHASPQLTPSPPRHRRRGGHAVSPALTGSPPTLADASTECESEGYQASSLEEADARSPHGATCDPTAITEAAEFEEGAEEEEEEEEEVDEKEEEEEEFGEEGTEEDEEEEGEEEEREEGEEEESDAYRDRDDIEDVVAEGDGISRVGKCAGVLAALGGCGAAAAMLAAADVAGLLPAAGG